MFHRQKILLALIEAFGGRLNSRDLQKYLFLFTEKCQQEKSYDFVPYKFGCFSFQSYADRRNLTDSGHLTAGEDWTLKTAGHLKVLGSGDAQKITAFHKHYSSIAGDNLIREVYRQYPYYATRSEIAARLMNDNELEKIKAAQPADDAYCFFTIGYEGSSFENYLNRLIKNNVKVLCDVRRNPLSRKYGFSKQTLSETLKKLGISYVHIPELGIASEQRQELNTQADYDRLFSEYERTTLQSASKNLQELFSLFRKHKRVAITCFEAQQCMCHRGRVAEALAKMPEWDYPTKHI